MSNIIHCLSKEHSTGCHIWFCRILQGKILLLAILFLSDYFAHDLQLPEDRTWFKYKLLDRFGKQHSIVFAVATVTVGVVVAVMGG